MKLIVNSFEKIEKVLLALSYVSLFIMMLLVFSNVISRTFLNKSINGTIEFTGEYLMVLVVYLSASYTQKKGGHINVTLLKGYLSNKGENIVNFTTNIIAAVFFIYISYINFIKALDYIDRNRTSSGVLDYPLGPALLILSVGLFMLSLRLFIECIIILKKKTYIDNKKDG